MGQDSEKLGPLSQIPLLRESALNLQLALQFFKLFTFEKGELIQAENEQLLSLHWLVKGSCRVVKTVPFILQKTQIGRKISALLRECTDDEILGPGETSKPHQLTIHSLDEGSFFPPIPNIPGYSPEEYELLFNDKSEFVKFFEELKPEDLRTWSQVSVIATSKCTIASIQLKDFMALAPVPLIKEMMQSPSVASFSLQEIQQAYLQKNNWQSHRKSVVNDLYRK